MCSIHVLLRAVLTLLQQLNRVFSHRQAEHKQLLKAESVVTLQSGDVLVWGGPERMLLHQVAGVAMGTCPAHLRPIIGDARINFTFRSAPNILGKEEQFATDKYWVDPSTK